MTKHTTQHTDEEITEMLKPKPKYWLIYISGKITGTVDLNRPKFKDAEKLIYSLRAISKSDHIIYMVNPHELDHRFCKLWSDHMRVDIGALVTCKEMFVLNDWEDSTGALVEVLIAKILGIPVFKVEDFDALKVSYFKLFRKLLFRL